MKLGNKIESIFNAKREIAMPDESKLKLFISYCHRDETYIEDFITHIAPLKEKGLLEEWYDRKITAGKDFQDHIDNKLDDADIICLCITANFLASTACNNEKFRAIEFLKNLNTVVIPIILEPCGWLDDTELSRLLALPVDGTPIIDFEKPSIGWNNVYNGLKELLVNENKIKNLRISDHFMHFLQSTDLLSRAHSHKDRVILDDIFVYPELTQFDFVKDLKSRVKSENLIANLHEYQKLIIAGENQSGKTTLCKIIYLTLRGKNFIPVYIYDKSKAYHGKIVNRIIEAYREQYETLPFEEIDNRRIVPIIDDFQFSKNKDKHLNDLSVYKNQIIIVDDIFNLNLKEDKIINQFNYFRINEFNPILRDKLIANWAHLASGRDRFYDNENAIYKILDQNTEVVNTTLGKIFGKGIMPAYPFFLLSILTTYDTFSKPLDEDITSQGYCYQAFIYMYLRKQGVKNEDVDTYMNFLSEFSFLFFENKKDEISPSEFDLFMESYLEKYNLPIDKAVLLEKLISSRLISLDNFSNYCFPHKYLYYFFVAKFLAEHLDDNKMVFDDIIHNLDRDENAYIAVFVTHHSKNVKILEEIVLNAYCLFDEHKPASLSTEELQFFNQQVNYIVQAVLPSLKESPENERKRRLSLQKDEEERASQLDDESQAQLDNFEKELRRAIKTVEVIGSIIKNRSGSLDKKMLKTMFEEAMLIHLRILTSFFEIIRIESEQEKIINFIYGRLKVIINNEIEERKIKGLIEREPSKEKLEKISRTIFWNLNFFTVYGLINKIITSLGSEKLTQIIDSVCEKENTPASLLIKHGILMWYNKNLQVDTIAKKMKDTEFSDIAKRIMNFLIVDHCSMHKINYKERQKIEQKFDISSKKLLDCHRQ